MDKSTRIVVTFECLGNVKERITREFENYDQIHEYMESHDVGIIEVVERGKDVQGHNRMA